MYYIEKIFFYLCLFYATYQVIVWYIDGQEKYLNKKQIALGMFRYFLLHYGSDYIPNGIRKPVRKNSEYTKSISATALLLHLFGDMLLLFYVIMLIITNETTFILGKYFSILFFIVNGTIILSLLMWVIIRDAKIARK